MPIAVGDACLIGLYNYQQPDQIYDAGKKKKVYNKKKNKVMVVYLYGT